MKTYVLVKNQNRFSGKLETSSAQLKCRFFKPERVFCNYNDIAEIL